MTRVRFAVASALSLCAALVAFTAPVKTQGLSRFILVASPDAVDDIAARYNLTVARSADDVATLGQWMEEGKIKPVIYATYAASSADGAAQAHRLMETNQHIGKIVLTW